MLSRSLLALLALLALSAFAQAGWFEDTLDVIVRRQEDSDILPSNVIPSLTPSTTPTGNPDDSSTPSVSPTPTSTPSTSPSITPSATSSGLSSSTTTTPFSTTSSSTSGTESSTSSSVAETTTGASTAPSQTTIQITHIRTIDGNLVTSVSESTSGSKPSSTNPAELADGGESSGSGMSPKTRSTVIGVVVGIGGAILLGGLAVVAWRIWGRKKGVDEGDDMMDYSRPDTGPEKTGSAGSSTNPFQSTLENYHNPAKGNASTNF